MSTRQKTITVHVCHSCGKDCEYPATCLSCGEPFCYACRDKGVNYPHAVHFSGSGDGFYCKPCDAKLASRRTTPNTQALKVYAAYRDIAGLRAEAKTWSEDFQRRSTVAEKTLKLIQEAAA